MKYLEIFKSINNFVKDEQQLELYLNYNIQKKAKGYKNHEKSHTDHVLNDLNGREWTILSKSVQKYNSVITERRKLHGAAFPIDLAKHYIRIYSKPYDYVLDPFAGVGTTLDAANILGRNALGMEINQRYVRMFSKGIDKKDGTLNKEMLRIIFQDDVINIKKYINKESVELILTSPPYSNLLNIIRKEFADKDFKGNKYKNQSRKLPAAYSKNPNDLGNLPYEDYLEKIRSVMNDLYFISKGGTYNVWVIRDFRNMNANIPYVNLHGDIISAAIKENWILWDIVIWDQSNQRKLVRLGGNNSRRYYFNIGHSFILIFRKNIIGETFENRK